MEVKVQLKHLIIVGLVVIYTFSSILFDLTNQLYNPTLNVAFIYDSLELGVENDANQVWEALNTIQSDFDFESVNTHFDSIELQNVNLSGKMIDHIGEYAVKNEVVTVFGDSYNEEIDQVIEANPQTEFIMIDSGYTSEYPNLSTIEIDNSDRIEVVAEQVAKTTETKKVLFVGNAEDVNMQLDEFRRQVNANVKCNITPLIFNDTSDNVAIKKQLLKEFNQGYDAVYVATRELNKIVIETAEEVQVDIIDDINSVDEANEKIENQQEIDDAQNTSTEEDASTSADDSTDDSTESIVNDEAGAGIISNDLEDNTSNTDNTTDEDNTSNTDNTTDEENTVDETNIITDENGNQVDEDLQINGDNETSNDTSEEVELEEYQYEQSTINVFVNGEANVSSGIYYPDEESDETSNVVRAYIDLNIEEVLYDMFSDILTGTIEHETIYLGFDNNGLELIEE